MIIENQVSQVLCVSRFMIINKDSHSKNHGNITIFVYGEATILSIRIVYELTPIHQIQITVIQNNRDCDNIDGNNGPKKILLRN